MRAELTDTLVTAIDDVFSKMLGRRVEIAVAAGSGDSAPPCDVMGTVGLTGPSMGMVGVYASRVAALDITGALLGLDAAGAVTDTEIADAMGEFTNLVAGAFRTKVADTQPWVMAIPVVVVGSQLFSRHAEHGERAVLTVTSGEHELFIELVVSELNGAQAA